MNDKPVRDDGAPYPESDRTLELQREQLIAGRRPAMLYPVIGGQAHVPFPAPLGMETLSTPCGVFHYNPALTSESEIYMAWGLGRLNDVLAMGPYCKDQIAARVKNGEASLAVVEYDPNGVDVKAAWGTVQTANEQLAAFEASKTPGHYVFVAAPVHVMAGRVAAVGSGGMEIVRELFRISSYTTPASVAQQNRP